MDVQGSHNQIMPFGDNIGDLLQIFWDVSFPGYTRNVVVSLFSFLEVYVVEWSIKKLKRSKTIVTLITTYIILVEQYEMREKRTLIQSNIKRGS